VSPDANGPSLVTVALAAAGVLPATVIGLFAGVVGVLALPCGASCQRYAIDFVDSCTRLARALVGARPTTRPPRRL
jgi:hypothetical protein